MFNNTAVPSLSDIAAVTGDRNNGGWDDGNGWWVLIILFALFGGWGNGWGGNNRGGNNNNSCCCESTNFIDSAIQRGFDNQGVMNKLNGIEQGICSLGYDQLNQMNGINNNIMQTGFGITNAINQAAIANMQDTNSLSRQLADCCCENRAAIAQVRYDMATQSCETRQTVNTAARDIIENQNANYRALHDEFVQFQLSSKDAKIAEQAGMIQALNLAASQDNQNRVIQGYINQAIATMRDCPIPSYNVPNPNCCYPTQWNAYPFNYYNNGGCCDNRNQCC